jgi:hypothetical protein
MLGEKRATATEEIRKDISNEPIGFSFGFVLIATERRADSVRISAEGAFPRLVHCHFHNSGSPCIPWLTLTCPSAKRKYLDRIGLPKGVRTSAGVLSDAGIMMYVDVFGFTARDLMKPAVRGIYLFRFLLLQGLAAPELGRSGATTTRESETSRGRHRSGVWSVIANQSRLCPEEFEFDSLLPLIRCCQTFKAR